MDNYEKSGLGVVPFSGLAASWQVSTDDNQVAYRVAPGAFQRTIVEAKADCKRRKDTILWPVLFEHRPERAFAWICEAAETPEGLVVRGYMDEVTSECQKVLADVHKGLEYGLSIGFRAIKQHYEGEVRVLDELALYEVSVGLDPVDERTKLVIGQLSPVENAIARAIIQEEEYKQMNNDYDDRDKRPRFPTPEGQSGQSDFRRAWNVQAGEPQPYSVEYGNPDEDPIAFQRAWNAELREEDDIWLLTDKNRMKELERRAQEHRDRQAAAHKAQQADRKAYDEWQAKIKAPVHTPETFSAATGIALAWVRAWFSHYVEAGMVEPVDRNTLALKNEDIRRMANRDAEAIEFQVIKARNKRQQGER